MKMIKAQQKHEKPSRTIKKDRYHRATSRLQGAIQIHKSRAYSLARLAGMKGETFEKLAKRMGVPLVVLGRWMRRDPKIRVAYGAGVDVVGINVEAAMIKRAIGYDVKKKVVTKRIDITGRILEHTTVESVEHIPGDVGAQKFFTSKRLGKRYQEKESSSGTRVNIYLDKSDEGI